jgi:hypothetical protein
MAKAEKNPPASRWGSETRLLAWWATCASVLSFLAYYQHGEILLYGDAVAHINIARRVFDSITPGPLQLGTVWLPLPHLLMVPFLISSVMWTRGLGGSIPSMAAYVFAILGIFRLVRGVLSRDGVFELPARIAVWSATLIFAANPNLIYLQSTAMGEPLYLAFFIWTIVFFAEFIQAKPPAVRQKSLTRCGLCLAAACLTRYDGWFLAAAMCAAAVILWILRSRRRPLNDSKKKDAPALPVRVVFKFILIAAAAPALWLIYNGVIYRNPLEFENGPYSAKAIERRTQVPGNPAHPGEGNLVVSAQFFLKSAEDNLAESQWLQRAWILLACLAAIVAAGAKLREINFRQRCAPLLLFLVPLPFYALSVAYGGVPIFVPQWWPFTHYNLRYGVQLLPLFAVAMSLLIYTIAQSGLSRRLRTGFVLGILVFVFISYASVWRAGPVSLKEAEINMRTRNHFEMQLASLLQKLPPNATLLMYLGDHVGALQRAGFPLRHVINEGNHRVWMQPDDSAGLWERALADPAHYADYVMAFEGDPVWQAMQTQHLRALIELHVTGQAPATLYRAR